ncbi:ribosomal protein L2 [Tanacetum coccineum]
MRDLTQHLTAQADDNHASSVSAFPKALLSFKRIHGMSSPGKESKSDFCSSGEQNRSSLNHENRVVGEQYKRRTARRRMAWLREPTRAVAKTILHRAIVTTYGPEPGGEMSLAPRASWFPPKCVEAQQLIGHLGVKLYFGAGHESGTKSRQTLNTRYDLKITRVKVGHDKGGRGAETAKRVPPQGSSTEGESRPKIRPKGVVDGQQVNIPVLPLVGPKGQRRLEGKSATLKLPSGEVRLISKNCSAIVRQVGNVGVNQKSLGRVGSKCWLGKRLVVRGVVMNPVDNPHGGGEGRAPIGRKKTTTP